MLPLSLSLVLFTTVCNRHCAVKTLPRFPYKVQGSHCTLHLLAVNTEIAILQFNIYNWAEQCSSCVRKCDYCIRLRISWFTHRIHLYNLNHVARVGTRLSPTWIRNTQSRSNFQTCFLIWFHQQKAPTHLIRGPRLLSQISPVSPAPAWTDLLHCFAAETNATQPTNRIWMFSSSTKSVSSRGGFSSIVTTGRGDLVNKSIVNSSPNGQDRYYGAGWEAELRTMFTCTASSYTYTCFISVTTSKKQFSCGSVGKSSK